MTRRTRRTVLVALVVVVLALGAYVAWTAYRVNDSLTAAVADATRLETALRTGDEAATTQALDDLSANADTAAGATDGPVWSLLTHVPVLGDDAGGVRAASRAVALLSGDGLRPLVTSTGRLDGLLPQGGRIDVQQLVALRDPVAQGAQALSQADEELAAEDPDTFIGRLAGPYRDLQQRVGDARTAVTSADTALQVMPSMLGQDGPRRYLLVFQNNAEVRATGGLPGAVSVLTADDGAVSLGQQVAASALGTAPAPALALTGAEEQIYGEVFGTFFLNATMTPDFPRAADLMRARWQQVYPEQSVDGVLAVDPVALSYLLRATGPVEVDGVALTSETVVDELLNNVYRRIADPAEQDAFFARAASAVFDRLLAGSASPQDALSALAQGAREHRLYVRSFAGAEQAVLQPTTVAGALITDPAAPPQVGLYLNDLTGSKMSYYLRTEVDVEATSCTADTQTYTGRTTLRSEAPADAASLPGYITGDALNGVTPGDQFVLARIHGPVGGSVTDLQIDGEGQQAQVVDQDGRPVVTTAVLLTPGQRVEVTWAMTSGRGQTGDTEVGVTPGIEPGNASFVSPSAC